MIETSNSVTTYGSDAWWVSQLRKIVRPHSLWTPRQTSALFTASLVTTPSDNTREAVHMLNERLSLFVYQAKQKLTEWNNTSLAEVSVNASRSPHCQTYFLSSSPCTAVNTASHFYFVSHFRVLVNVLMSRKDFWCLIPLSRMPLGSITASRFILEGGDLHRASYA